MVRPSWVAAWQSTGQQCVAQEASYAVAFQRRPLAAWRLTGTPLTFAAADASAPDDVSDPSIPSSRNLRAWRESLAALLDGFLARLRFRSVLVGLFTCKLLLVEHLCGIGIFRGLPNPRGGGAGFLGQLRRQP